MTVPCSIRGGVQSLRPFRTIHHGAYQRSMAPTTAASRSPRIVQVIVVVVVPDTVAAEAPVDK